MNNSLSKLKTYFNQAKITEHNDGITAFSLATSSSKAIEALREYQAQTSSLELKELCEETISNLRLNESHIQEYRNSCSSGSTIGDNLIFIKINHTLYNALDSFFAQIDQTK